MAQAGQEKGTMKYDYDSSHDLAVELGFIGVTSIDQEIIDTVGMLLLGIDYGEPHKPDENWEDYYNSLNL